MSRPLRIQYIDAWYHVMNRGRRGEDVFIEEQDYQLFVKVLKESSELWNVKISAFCLMSNHYHLLIQTPGANLSRCMRHINGVFTQRFNRAHGIDGQIFRGRYKSILVGEENYLIEILRYIHFNPTKGGLVDDPAEYAWSSFNAYMSNDNSWDWIYKSYIFKLLGIEEKESSEKKQASLKKDASPDIYAFFKQKNLPSIMGSKEFSDKIKTRFFHKMAHPEVPESKDLAPHRVKIIQEVSYYFDVKKDVFFEQRRGWRNTPRDVAVYLVRRITRKKLLDIGDFFKMDNYSSVSSAIDRATKRISEDKNLEQFVIGLINETT